MWGDIVVVYCVVRKTPPLSVSIPSYFSTNYHSWERRIYELRMPPHVIRSYNLSVHLLAMGPTVRAVVREVPSAPTYQYPLMSTKFGQRSQWKFKYKYSSSIANSRPLFLKTKLNLQTNNLATWEQVPGIKTCGILFRKITMSFREDTM